MRTRRLLLALSLSTLLSSSPGALTGCVEPDLGEAPVYCNLYEPRCPAGYVCQRRDARELCVREGSASASPWASTAADGGAADGVQAP